MVSTSSAAERRGRNGEAGPRAFWRVGSAFGRVRLFNRQVVAELKKVVRPTRHELLTYTWVVLIFVLAVMAFVSALDYGFGKLVIWVFSG